MSQFPFVGIGLLVVLSFLFTACAPQAAPASAPATPTPATVMPAPAAATAPAPSPADAAWQQVEQAARKEGRLVVYDSTYFAGDKGRAVAKAFKEKYGITVEVLVMGGSSATIERLRAEKRVGQSVADIVTTGSVSGPNLISMGFIQKGVDKELPALKDKSVFTLDPVYSPEGEEFTIDYLLLTPAVNTNLVKSGEIQSFKDFLDPKWKGKMITRDPRLGSGPTMLFIVTMRLLNILDDEYFVSLGKQNPVLSGAGEQEIVQMVARGEFPIAYNSPLSSAYMPLMKEGAPLRVLNLKEGTVGMPGVIQMTKDSPHSNASKLFINFMLTAEGQTIFHRAQGTQSVRKDVPDFTPSNLDIEPMKKLLPTKWEVGIKTTEEVKAGVMEKFFGKR